MTDAPQCRYDDDGYLVCVCDQGYNDPEVFDPSTEQIVGMLRGLGFVLANDASWDVVRQDITSIAQQTAQLYQQDNDIEGVTTAAHVFELLAQGLRQTADEHQ